MVLARLGHLLAHVIEDPGAVIGKHLLVVLFLWYEILWGPTLASRATLQDTAVDAFLLQVFSCHAFQVEDNVVVRLDENFSRGAILASPGKKGERLEYKEVVMLGKISHLKKTWL